jgi:nucleotide-binding universal stress UspA family protein
MKKILIALDYDGSADKVAETGYAIAKTLNAEIAMVHVITEPAWYNEEKIPFMGYYHGHNTGATAYARDIKKEAVRFLAASVIHLGDSNIKTIVLEGKAANAILKFSEAWKADLIVMGSHRRHGLDRLHVTHVAAYVLGNSKIPLLTVPTEGKWPAGQLKNHL